MTYSLFLTFLDVLAKTLALSLTYKECAQSRKLTWLHVLDRDGLAMTQW